MNGFKKWFIIEAYIDRELRPVDPKNKPKDVTSLMKHLRVSRYDDPPYKQLLDFVGKNGNLQTFERIIEDDVKQIRIWTSFDPCKMAGIENPQRAGEAIGTSGYYRGGETTGVSGAEMNQHGRSRIFSADDLPLESQMKYAAIYGPGDTPKNSDYGPFSIEWNADALKDRMTVATGDTLESDGESLDLTDIENIIVIMLRIGIYHKTVDKAATQAGVNINDPQYKQILNNAKKTNFSSYMEVQIWGELPLTKDTVKGLYIFDNISEKECEASALAVINSFKAKGIPVHFDAKTNLNDPNLQPNKDPYKDALLATLKHLKPGINIGFTNYKGKYVSGIVQKPEVWDRGPRNSVRIVDTTGETTFLSSDPRNRDGNKISVDEQGNLLVNNRPVNLNAPPPKPQPKDGDNVYLKMNDGTKRGYMYNINYGPYNEPMFSYEKLTPEILQNQSKIEQLRNQMQILPMEHEHMKWNDMLKAWDAGIQRGWTAD
jgi:hypothetical protein